MNSQLKEKLVQQLSDELFRFCGPIFIAPELNSYPNQMIAAGTYALIDTGEKRLLVTCCHVWDEYEKHHDKNSKVILAVSLGEGESCIAFQNPKSHRIAIDRDLDLVVFEFEPEEIKIPHNKGWFNISDWPIARIEKEDHIVTMGFPGAWRKTSHAECNFRCVAMPFAVSDVSNTGFAAFSDGKNNQVLNDMKNSLGGISGSPAYCFNTNRELRLVGFAKSGSEMAVFFTHASFLQPDGSLSSANGNSESLPAI
jgi:hypothetical protein